MNRFRTLLHKISLQRRHILRHLQEFSTTVGRCRHVVDVGSGESNRYGDLFEFDLYLGLDRFRYADVVADAGAIPYWGWSS